jgi:hypothetical protein
MPYKKNPYSVKKLEEALDIEVAAVYNVTEQKVRVRSAYPACLKYTGLVTGERYEWKVAGTVIEVFKADVEDLLSKRLGSKACCGSPSLGNVLFVLD